jgi:hypothetical protein
MYCNQIKHLLPKPIGTAHIATTANKNDLMTIERYYDKYSPIATILYVAICQFLVAPLLVKFSTFQRRTGTTPT